MALVPFIFYSALRPDIRGFDSYAFLSQSCGKFVVKDTPVLANYAINLIPCNILAVKAVLFSLFFLSLLGLGCLGSLFHKEKGWMAALFSFLSPILILEATKFENDQFAIPILIWATYFYYKARVSKQHRFDLIALALIVLAAGFWQGAIFFLLAFALSSFVFAFPGMVGAGIFGNRIVSSLIQPANKAVEMQPILGIALIGGLAIGFSLLPTIMFPQAAIFFILLVLQMKYAWMIAPLLSVGVLMFYVNPKLEKNAIARQAKGIILVLSLFLVVAWGFALQGYAPHSYQWEAVDFAIEQSGDGNVWNDWTYGYWVIWRGGHPSQFGGGDANAQILGQGVWLSYRELPCPILKEFNEVIVYDCP